MSTTLPLYWDLASLDPQIRFKAAKTLIESLMIFQSQHTDKTNTEEHEKWMKTYQQDRDPASFEKLVAEDVSYAIKRLIRGLPSSRDGARQGFTLALIELLKNITFLQTKTVLDLIDKFTEVSGGLKPKEETDLYFGKVFGYHAIVESSVLLERATKQDLERIITNLTAFAKKRSFLKEASFSLLNRIVNRMSTFMSNDSGESFKKDCQSSSSYSIYTVFDIIKEIVLRNNISTPEELWLALNIEAKGADISSLVNENKAWKCKKTFLHADNMGFLKYILKETTWNHPRMHSVWNSILSAAVKITSSTSNIQSKDDENIKCQLTVSMIWKHLVEDTLLESSPERQFLCIKIFEFLLPQIHDKNEISSLFSIKFIRFLTSNLSSPSKLLHKAAKKAIVSTSEAAKANPRIALEMSMRLFSVCSPQLLENLKKQKIFSTVLSSLDENGASVYIQELIQSFEDLKSKFTGNRDAAIVLRARQRLILENLAMVFKGTDLTRTEKHVADVLSFFVKCAFTTGAIKNEDNDNNQDKEYIQEQQKQDEQLSIFAQDKLTTGLSYLTKSKLNDSCSIGISPSGHSWAHFALKTVKELSSSDDVKFSIDNASDDEEIQEMRTNAFSFIAKVEKQISAAAKSQDINLVNKMNPVLFLAEYTLLMSYMDASLLPALGDIQACFGKMFSTKPKASKNNANKKRKCDDEAEQIDEDDLNPNDVLVDVLLNFLSRPSNLLRSVTEKTFKEYSADITSKGIELIFDALNSKEDEMDIEDDEEEEEELEMEDSATEDEEESKDSEDDEDEEKDVDFETKNNDTIDIDSEESDVGDDQMAAFDAKLVEMFKHQKDLKKNKKAAKTNSTHFKTRVLDLLDALLKAKEKQPMMLDVAIPFVNFIQTLSNPKDEQTVLQKSISILNSHYKIKNCPDTVSDQEEIFGGVSKILELCMKGSTKPLMSCFNAILKCLTFSLYKSVAQNKSVEKAAAIALNDKKANNKKNIKKAKISTGDEDEQTKQSTAVSPIVSRLLTIFKKNVEKMCSRKKAMILSEMLVDLSQYVPEIGFPSITELSKHISIEGMGGKMFKIQAALQCVLDSVRKSQHASVEDKQAVIISTLNSVDQVFFANKSNNKENENNKDSKNYDTSMQGIQSQQKTKDLLKIYATLYQFGRKQLKIESISAEKLEQIASTNKLKVKF